MPVNLYTDKFRQGEHRDQAQESGTGASGGKSKDKKKGWEVIKKAIFTPIGTREQYPLERRRRSRRNCQPRKSGEMTETESDIAPPFPQDPSRSQLPGPGQPNQAYQQLAQTYQHDGSSYFIPSNGGHPTSGYPTSGYPPTGYPPTGYPTPGYPPTGYPTTSYQDQPLGYQEHQPSSSMGQQNYQLGKYV